MRHVNSKKRSRLESFPLESIDSVSPNINGLMSFNFKYLDTEQGDKFSDLTNVQFSKIIEKLKWYSNENRQHWETKKTGQSTVLAVYGDFPHHSDFYHPKHVPAGVRWARFRMEGDQRLVGFVINNEDSDKIQLNTNVFYVVFLDNNHRFYKTNR